MLQVHLLELLVVKTHISLNAEIFEEELWTLVLAFILLKFFVQSL